MHTVKKNQFKRIYSGKCVFCPNAPISLLEATITSQFVYFSRDILCIHNHRDMSHVVTDLCVCVRVHSFGFTPHILLCVFPHLLYLPTAPYPQNHINIF